MSNVSNGAKIFVEKKDYNEKERENQEGKIINFKK